MRNVNNLEDHIPPHAKTGEQAQSLQCRILLWTQGNDQSGDVENLGPGTFAMWWNKSPPLTNSMAKKSLSVVWNAAKRVVMKRDWPPRARTSLSNKLVSAVSSFRMSFLFTILIAHISRVLFLSARITCRVISAYNQLWFVPFQIHLCPTLFSVWSLQYLGHSFPYPYTLSGFASAAPLSFARPTSLLHTWFCPPRKAGCLHSKKIVENLPFPHFTTLVVDVQVAIWGGALVALLRDPPQQGPTELTESWLSISLQFEVVGNSSFKLHGIPPSLLRQPTKIGKRLT